MLRELLAIFRASDPLDELSQDFGRMLRLAHEMSVTAGQTYFGEIEDNDAARLRLYGHDKEVNGLEQAIRRRVFLHLTVHGQEVDVPFYLSLMSLVKDVERMGDYAKNLAQLGLVDPKPLPEGGATDALQTIRNDVERSSQALPTVFLDSQKDEAVTLIRHGREMARRCDALVASIAGSDYDSGTTTILVLGARYYKRLGGHVLNVLSSVVMPIDKLDYFDEQRVTSSP